VQTLAKYWHTESDCVVCDLCPRGCRITEGQRGFCFVRRNQQGSLVSDGYGNFSSVAVDPVEKKPLYHFLPDTKILSFGVIGCNLSCSFCQNWEISQSRDLGLITRAMTPRQWADLCVTKACSSIAFTYNEPLITFENTYAVAEHCKARGLKTALVSAGYINHEPLAELTIVIDAANIDLKAFNDEFYHKLCGVSLQPVLDSLLLLKARGVELEITNLIIPDCNDAMSEITAMCNWIYHELGADTPLHFSAYHPAHRLSKRATDFATLHDACQIAKQCGLHYVYIGNVTNVRFNSTFCPQCNALLIERCGYNTKIVELLEGKCSSCGKEIAGIWK
jgi:pyruvate formate lyase activating enzyme